MTKEFEEKKNPWPVIIVVLVILFLISAFSALIIGLFSTDDNFHTGNTVIIPITGVITGEGDNSLFGSGGISSTDIVNQIKDAENDDTIKAVIFEINSPGGSPVASHEIAKAIKNMTKPNVAFIREVGASGAYWAASSCDYIIADELSVVGSVGVLSSYLNFYEIMDRYNITYERLVAGEYKDIESQYRQMTPEERKIVEFKLQTMHEFFLNDVATSRNLSRQQRSEVSSAMYYLGLESIDLNLIDQFGGEEEARLHLQTSLGIPIETYRIEQSRGFFDLLTSASAEHGFQVGRGLGQTLVESQNGKIELK
jgi:protease-4